MMTWEARFGLRILGLRALCLSEEGQGKQAWPMAHPFSSRALLCRTLCVWTRGLHIQALPMPPPVTPGQKSCSQPVGFTLSPRGLCPGAGATSRAEPSEARGPCNLGLRKLLLLRLYCETSSTLIDFSVPCL